MKDYIIIDKKLLLDLIKENPTNDFEYGVESAIRFAINSSLDAESFLGSIKESLSVSQTDISTVD